MERYVSCEIDVEIVLLAQEYQKIGHGNIRKIVDNVYALKTWVNVDVYLVYL